MPSRQDQLHSYQFMVQRVVTALTLWETDPARSPLRRTGLAALAGVLVAAIALGAVAAYGAIVGGGSTNWRDTSAVIVEKESGARYVFREGRLHLVPNYASALLIVGSAQPRTVLVSRRSIEGVPRGTPLGIPDAPESLPAASRLLADPWTVCSAPAPAPAPAPPATRSVLLVGASVPGGTVLGDAALLARDAEGNLHLVWRARRHLVRDEDLVLSALAWTSERAVPLPPAVLNALPAGLDLARVPVPGEGEPSAGVPGARVGEVFMVSSQGGGREYAVAQRDGLAGITQVQADLLLTATGQNDPTPMAQGRFAHLPRVADLMPDDPAAPPADRPDLVRSPGASVCVRASADEADRQVRVGASVPDPSAMPTVPAVPGRVSVDHVVVEPGRAAVVEAVPATGAAGGTVSVVTDLGRAHPVVDREALAMLGYGDVAPVRMPAGVVALLPLGRALDPVAARAPAGQR